MKGLALVVPCYNEENAINETLQEVIKVFENVPENDYEIIFVNDGSSDQTGPMLDSLSEQYPIQVVHHQINRGYGAALKTGISQTQRDYIAITDADGTYPNDRIVELYQTCMEGNYDMVTGARTGEDVTYSKIRKIPKYFLKRWINQIAGQDIPDFNSGLRVFTREKALKYMGILPNTFSFTTTITLAMHTNWERVLYVPVSYNTRVGKSKIKPVRDTLRFSMLIARTGMYFAPSRLLFPAILIISAMFGASMINDVINFNMTDKSIILFSLLLNIVVVALLADMINKRVLK